MSTKLGRGALRAVSSSAGGRMMMMGSHPLWLLQASPYKSGHYVCHVCWERGSGPLYHCPDCQLDFHVACVAGTGGNHVAQSHFSHFEHPLLLKSSVNSGDEVLCDGCGEAHHGTGSYVYRCNQCDFDLCPLCVRAPRFLLHTSHPHILALATLEEVGSGCQCDGCGKSARGMMYRCTCCNFDLHMSCTRLPLKPMLSIHPDHPLTLIFQDDDVWQSSYTCNACGLEGRGWAYTCSICRFHLHPHCGKAYHELPRTSSSGSSHFRQMDSKVTQRANLSQRNYNNLHNALSSLGTRHGSNSFMNRSYSSSSRFNDPSYSYPYNSHTYSNTSFDRLHNNYSSPRAYGDNWNSNIPSTNAIAQALSNRVTPLSQRDAEAVDRVMGLLRQNEGHPY